MPAKKTKHTYITCVWDDAMVLGDDRTWHDTENLELETPFIPVCGMLLKETKKYLLIGLCHKEGCTVGNPVQIPKAAISKLKRYKFDV